MGRSGEPLLEQFVLEPVAEGEEPFADDKFCGARALFRDPSLPPRGHPAAESVRWLRPAEVCSAAGAPDPQLFVDSSSSSDVVQGGLGDCWFLSALGVIALRPELLARIFSRWREAPAGGKCTFVFYHDGNWLPVTIDDRLPCDSEGRLLYARASTIHEMWVPLVEKAYAKFHGSYEALVSGFADTAMRHLTGGAPQRWTVRSSDGRGDAADELWARLVRWTSESSPVGCAHSHAVAQKLQAEAARGTQDGISTHSATVFDGCSSSCADAASSSLPKEVHDLGLLRGHAYGLELVREIAGRRLLRLRNPWGRGEWTGAWADGASEWSEELLSALEYSFSDDGTFWMELHDFCTQFNVLYMARLFEGGDWGVRSLRGQWQGRSAAGCPGHNASWRSNPAISFALSQECELFCVLGRSDISKAKCGDALSRPSSPQLVSRTLRPSSPHTRTPSSVQDTLHSLGFALASVSQLVRTAHASSMKGIDIAVSGLPLRYEPEVSSAEESRLRAGIYAIVPFTFRSEIEGAWRLEVRCSRADALHIDRWESVDALIAAHGIGANGIGGSMAQTGPDVNPSQQLSPPQKADLDEMDLWMEVTEDLDPEEAFGHDRYSASGALAFLGSREERRLSREAAALSEAYLAEQCDEMRPAWEAFMSQALSRGDPPHSLATVDDALSRLALKKQEVHHERAFSRAARIGRAPTQRPARTPALTQSLPEDIRQGAAEAVRKAKVELARRQTPAATTTLLGSTTYSPNMLAKTGRHTSLHASDNLATIAASCRRDARPTARVPFQPSSHGSFQRNTNKGASRWEVRMPPPPPHWGAL